MHITIKATGMDLTDAIREYVEKKIGSLEKFIDPEDSSAHAAVEVEATQHQKKGDVFRAEVNLHIAGADFRAESTMDDEYAAIDQMKEELSRDLRRHKRKNVHQVRKGGRELKRQAQEHE